jgi:hypothetical protein
MDQLRWNGKVMVWGLIHGSWRHRTAALISEFRMLKVTSNELWQFNWQMRKRSGFGVSDDGSGSEEGKGGGESGITGCGMVEV